jgi:hypothetical protein
MKRTVKRQRITTIKREAAERAPQVMSGAAFKANIEKIYGTPICQSAFARLIDHSDRTVRQWISEVYPVPVIVAQLVNLMLRTKTKPEDLRAI